MLRVTGPRGHCRRHPALGNKQLCYSSLATGDVFGPTADVRNESFRNKTDRLDFITALHIMCRPEFVRGLHSNYGVGK